MQVMRLAAAKRHIENLLHTDALSESLQDPISIDTWLTRGMPVLSKGERLRTCANESSTET